MVWWCAVAGAVSGAGAGEGGAAPAPALLFRSRSTFDVQSTLLLNEAGGKQRDVGYRLEGSLTLEPVALDPTHDSLLLSFRVSTYLLCSPYLTRGHATPSHRHATVPSASTSCPISGQSVASRCAGR